MIAVIITAAAVLAVMLFDSVRWSIPWRLVQVIDDNRSHE